MMWQLIKTLQDQGKVLPLLVAVLYSSCSAVMAFFNKLIVDTYDFNFPFTILGGQMVTTILVLKILNRSGAVVVPDYTRKSGMAFLAPSFGYAAHASLSLMAVHGMNIPMYAAIKRCSPLASLILSVVLLHKPIPSPKVVSSILIITVGCLVAALNSAVTTTIVGIPKSIIQTVVGFFVFGGVKYHPVNIIGIVMNTFGCVLYSCAKWEEQIKKKNKSDTNEPIDTNESVGLNK
ncbi:uncharacterized protein LOC143028396 isoform X5 [Oratosquilla oratoria]|uniref:uncharacterized protein LOC143028396 isoform X5 n=1 Tax=Oratosquilla oratoria TaxID=337810 RepID=UPI003F76EE73